MEFEWFLIIVSFLITHVTVTRYVIKRGQSHYESVQGNGKQPVEPFWDIIGSNTPDLSRYNYTKNVFLLVFIVPLMYGIVVSKDQVRRKILREFGMKLAILIFLRALTIGTTIFPKTPSCKPFEGRREILNYFVGGGCYDKMFSGHMSFGVLASLICWKHKLLPNTLFGGSLLVLLNLLHLITLGATRSHFTVDLVVAIYITGAVFYTIP